MTLIRRKENDVLGAPVYLRDEVNRLFENFFSPANLAVRDAAWHGSFVPALDISETATGVTVTAEIPGLDPADVDINLTGNLLTLRGEKKEESEEKGRNWHRLERSYGSFSRSIQLPESADPEKVKATCENGVLRIDIGKSDASRPRSIKVDVKR